MSEKTLADAKTLAELEEVLGPVPNCPMCAGGPGRGFVWTLADLADLLGYEPTGYTARRGLTTAERVLAEKLAASQGEVEYNIGENIEDCRKYDERITLMADRQTQRREKWAAEKAELTERLEKAEARIEELTSWGRAVVERQNTLFPAYEEEEEGVQENDSTK